MLVNLNDWTPKSASDCLENALPLQAFSTDLHQSQKVGARPLCPCGSITVFHTEPKQLLLDSAVPCSDLCGVY